MILGFEIALAVLLGFFLFYVAALSVLALFVKQQPMTKTSRMRKMAVIVPAHNEELTIGRTIHSVLAVDYPRRSFDVIVIADNCADGTARVARSLGTIVYERQNQKLRGKGYALRWCFDRLLSTQAGYEAVVIIDADSVVSRNFLAVMNFHLEKGAKAIQSSDMVEPRPGAWSSEVTRIGFILYNYVRPLGRRAIGCSAGLRGNGMCFAVDTLRSVPWNAYSLAEDLEYGLELVVHGITVVFAPEAIVYSPMPQSAENAESQRARWEAGRFPLVRKYAGQLLRFAFKRASFKAFDAFVDLVTPPLVNLLVFVVFMFLLHLFLGAVGIDRMTRFAWLWLALAGLGGFYLITGLYAGAADRLVYKALLYVPRYAAWKILLYTKLLWRGQGQGWIRTTRE